MVWSQKRESNPYARLGAADFKSATSTSSVILGPHTKKGKLLSVSLLLYLERETSLELATSSTYMGKLFVQILAQSLRLMMRMACRRNETATNRLPSNSLTKAFMQLRYLKANKPTDRNAWKTKEIPKKIRDLFTLLGLPLPPRVFRD